MMQVIPHVVQAPVQPVKEIDDAEKSDKSETKNDDSSRNTRKTPKRAQGDPPKLSAIVEMKGADDSIAAKESPDIKTNTKPLGSDISKTVKQRRANAVSAVLRLSRADVGKTKIVPASTGSSGTKEERSGKKLEGGSVSGTEDKSDRKASSSSKSVIGKEDGVVKKKSADSTDSSDDKKVGRMDSKRPEHMRGEKSLPHKRVSSHSGLILAFFFM